MLKIIKRGFYAAGREALYSEIAGLIEKGRRSMLIVPEQQTVMTEAMASKYLPDTAPLLFEATNFTRLANTTFRTLGGLSGEYCDRAKEALIMWKTLTGIGPSLSAPLAKNLNAGIVESYLTAVSEMQGLGITPKQLSDSADDIKVKDDKRLKNKLSDLAKIYSHYKTLLSEKYTDSADEANAMLEKLAAHPDFLCDTDIFIEGFTSFTAPQYKLIGLLSERTDVKVMLTVPPSRESSFEFKEIMDCQSRLAEVGFEAKSARDEVSPRAYSEDLAEISSLLWVNSGINDNITLQDPDSLRIFEAQTPFDECEFICSDIRRRVMEGSSYSDFAIIARGAEKYDGILDGALQRAAIPAFTSYRRDVNEFEATKLIYTAYAAIRSFAREDVISYAKCPLSGITREECDELEMYVNRWQISGKRFTDGIAWNMNTLGYSVNRPSGLEEKLLRINAVREKTVTPLIRLSERAAEAKTVGEHAKVLFDFLTEIDLEGNLMRRAELMSSLGESEMARQNLALWDIIVNAIDTVYEVMENEEADKDSFLSRLKAVLAHSSVATIPAFADEVTVGSADMLRLYEKPHVYLIGVNAGEFPQAVSDNSYFSESDKRILESIKLPIVPDLKIRNARELYFFTRAFSYATESVTLSYSAQSTRFKAINHSDVVSRIMTITGESVKPVKISSLSVCDRLYSASDAISSLGTPGKGRSTVKDALVRSGKGREVGISEGRISNDTHVLSGSALDAFNSRPLSLTQTRIDKYVSCPFGHFCKYTVSLSEDAPAEFDAASVGSFVHAILENFFRECAYGGKSAKDMTHAEREALTRRAAEDYLRLLGDEELSGSATTRIKITRLARAALPVIEELCEEFSTSLFQPKFFELALSDKEVGAPKPIVFSTDTGAVRIFGVIDRVDTFKSGDDVYVRVVDYKTGHKNFSPDDMAEGKNLQMFLYLKSLVDNTNEPLKARLGVTGEGRLIPAGVIYVKTAIGDVKVSLPDDSLVPDAVRQQQSREGMVIKDEEIISAMNLRYTPAYSAKSPGKILPSMEKYLFDEYSFDDIMKTVEAAVVEVANKMHSGRIEAVPKCNGKETPCEYCEFKPICRSAKSKREL